MADHFSLQPRATDRFLPHGFPKAAPHAGTMPCHAALHDPQLRELSK